MKLKIVLSTGKLVTLGTMATITKQDLKHWISKYEIVWLET